MGVVVNAVSNDIPHGRDVLPLVNEQWTVAKQDGGGVCLGDAACRRIVKTQCALGAVLSSCGLSDGFGAVNGDGRDVVEEFVELGVDGASKVGHTSIIGRPTIDQAGSRVSVRQTAASESGK